MSPVHTVFAGRYGHCERLTQRGHDDAAACNDFAAVQADIIHSC